jgi:hypothetical protein
VQLDNHAICPINHLRRLDDEGLLVDRSGLMWMEYRDSNDWHGPFLQKLPRTSPTAEPMVRPRRWSGPASSRTHRRTDFDESVRSEL